MFQLSGVHCILKRRFRCVWLELGSSLGGLGLKALRILETLNPKPYLNPEEATFLGLFIMISLYKSLKW